MTRKENIFGKGKMLTPKHQNFRLLQFKASADNKN